MRRSGVYRTGRQEHARVVANLDTPTGSVKNEGWLIATLRTDHAAPPAATHPHSLYPHTWHFTHPSANSSCEPQSGQVPMNCSSFIPPTW